jgi:methylenetetrahydrofolate dehydrogenase (NADP+)/methenyltetrahydrofolate cyclohydrolase
MPAKIIDGNAISEKILAELKSDVEALKKKNYTPHLVAVQVGENPSSRVYVKNQQRSCEDLGMKYTLDELPVDTKQDALLAHIDKLNADKSVHGIIIQMPLPEGIDQMTVQTHVTPNKDVEGMTAANMGYLVYGEPNLAPCTAMGAYLLIKSLGVPLRGKEVTIIGRSKIVGRPLFLLLLMDSVTPVICHTGTADLKAHARKADILVAAVGKAGFVTADMVKPGAIVIDVGINRVPALDESGRPLLNEKGKPKMKTVGDVDFDAVKEVAGMITPVPGGVGPMTVAMLLKNTVLAAQKAAGALQN